MSIPIYQSEINDGLESAIAKSVAHISIAQPSVDFQKILKKIISVANNETVIIDQPDLSTIVAILVSTGWNLNDDIFLPAEMWAARKTPIHKPINLNHEKDRIVGHIFDSKAINKNGTEIPDNIENIPLNFDIEVAGVVYKSLSSNNEEINQILDKAKNNQMFVSMECWFTDFDYGFVDKSNGNTKIISRTEDTAFLTKHLRIFGGSGQYNGFKIGRVLKNIIFGGQAFVENPANPESVIKSVAKDSEYEMVSVAEIMEGGVQSMDKVDNKETKVENTEKETEKDNSQETIANLEKTLKDKDSEIESLKKDITDKDSVISEANQKIEDLNKEVESFKTKETELSKANKDLETKVGDLSKELNDIRKNEMAKSRLAKLKEVKNIDNEEETLAELKEMTNEHFDIVLKYAGEKKDSETEASETEKEEETEGVTEAEVLNSAEAEETPDDNFGSDNESNKESAVVLATAMRLLNKDKNNDDNKGVKANGS